MRKIKRISHGRGQCPFCKTSQPKTQYGILESHPVPGNARGASRCAGTGRRPMVVSAK